jgi:hypothetical protein
LIHAPKEILKIKIPPNFLSVMHWIMRAWYI